MKLGISAHIHRNLWMWILVLVALTAAAGSAQYMMGTASPMGHWLALFGATLGGLIMLKSEEGAVPLVLEDDAA